MGLDFLKNVKDQEGAAIYLIHNGSGFQERQLTDFATELQKHTKKEPRVFSYRNRDGAQLADFYDILEDKLPAILIVRDTDELAASWFGISLPQADQVAYQADQISN